MITTARQLKDLIRNLSKKKSADAQTLMRNYMMERFLERISLSEYKDKFILKGGMLVAAMVGLDARATMDLDATIKAANVSLRDVEMIISNIIAIPIDDGVSFRIKRISEIMEEADYPGVRVSMETKFDGVIIPLKIDISTGDVITPKEIRYRFNLMLEDRTIEVWAYNLETVFAEKLETVISRNVSNTRMRDFYDIYILQKLHGEQLNKEILWHALVATARKRGTLEQIESGDIREILNEIETSSVMENLWKAYQKNYSYAVDISWHIVMESVRYLYQIGCSVDF
ncbi:MAG: nucleotidyl transferase AbiEii/AbiGii toxin family protein [Lachnospiraceae bacterium]|nr:nucleotidyl transferase AbiEii/AbiGii toxin family protein [Lachnospiraceae bacterium]